MTHSPRPRLLSALTMFLLLPLAACAPADGDEPVAVDEHGLVAQPRLDLTCGLGPDQCFGVVGLGCAGGGLPDVGRPGGCVGDDCLVNAGSWRHDQCCAANPKGIGCAGPGTGAGMCGPAFSRSVQDLRRGLSWRRVLEGCTPARGGFFDFAALCAPGGTVVHHSDVDLCCSGRARALDPARDGVRIGAQSVRFDSGFAPTDARACEEPPSNAGKSCTSHSQCTQGQVCITVSTSPLVRRCGSPGGS